MAPDACPCGALDARGKPVALAQCCGRYLDGTMTAPDAQALMRSRYSAFVREDAAYLLATWHPDTRPAALEFGPATQWLGLEVKSFTAMDAHHASVEFVARYRQQGRAVRLHERSRFVREMVDGLLRWRYVDGTLS